MEKLSGLVLDIYDDPKGEVLKTIFPTYETIPEMVKSAQQITSEDHAKLPDDAFALILEQHGQELKKFATIDPGNTALSVEYFLKTAHKLPVEAQKVAAHNLCVACDWFGIEPPEELQKVAVSEEWIKKMVAGGMRKATPERLSRFREAMWAQGNKSLRKLVKVTNEALGKNPSLKDVAASLKAGRPIVQQQHKRHVAFRETLKKLSALEPQKVTVSRDPKVRERQLEALKSRGIEADTKIMGPTKTAMIKKAIGIMPLAMGALTIPGAAKETSKNLAARQGLGGAIVTPAQLELRRQQMGLVP
jgi:hypothetical protein